MLVTFSCQAYPNVTLFGNIGQQFLKIMGCLASPTGIISAQNLPEVLARLKKAIALEEAKSTPKISTLDEDLDFNDEPVSFAHRALPLIELLNAAIKEKCNVWWETT